MIIRNYVNPKMLIALLMVAIGLVFVSNVPTASAAGGWTVLGGDPLFEGGIPNAGQEGRNKFVHDMLSPKGVTAQKRAGLGAKERQAFKQALVHGEFEKCTLHVGDHFEAMSYGVGAVFVDHNVTFEDSRYSGSGAPAFCASIEVGKSGSIVNIKVPFKCENFSVVNRVHRKPSKPKPEKPQKKHKKPHKKKPAPTCSTKSPNAGGGNCNEQVVTTTVTPEQKCGADNHSSAGGCTQNTTTITNVYNCSNGNNENTGSTINNGGNCNNGGTETCVGQNNCTTKEETCVNNSCNVTPPPAEEVCTDHSATNYNGPLPCKYPPPVEPPSILITSTTVLNMIPAEKNSGPFKIKVNASKAGGSLAIDPGIGTVSSCSSSTGQETLTISNLPSGESEQCVIIYAPENDADHPTSMTVSETAILGSAHDHKEQTFKITYPVRPE
jgi:hypothetical protein